MRSAIIFLCLSLALGILFLIYRQICIDYQKQQVLEWYTGTVQEMFNQQLQYSDKQDNQ